MKFPRPSAPGDAPHPQGSAFDKPRQGNWLKEWLANKGNWVLLECGNKADLNDNGQTMLVGLEVGELRTICVKCWLYCRVERHISINEYLGIPTAVIPDEPLF